MYVYPQSVQVHAGSYGREQRPTRIDHQCSSSQHNGWFRLSFLRNRHDRMQDTGGTLLGV